MSAVLPHKFFAELDGLLDADSFDEEKKRRIEEIFQELTIEMVAVIPDGTFEGLNTPYTTGFNPLLTEVGYRCEDARGDIEKYGYLCEITGRIKQALLTVDMADNTAPSVTVINDLKKRPVYLGILDLLEAKGDQEVAIADLAKIVGEGELDFILDWLQDRQLIIIDPPTIRFGLKGPETLEAIREEQKTN